MRGFFYFSDPIKRKAEETVHQPQSQVQYQSDIAINGEDTNKNDRIKVAYRARVASTYASSGARVVTSIWALQCRVIESRGKLSRN